MNCEREQWACEFDFGEFKKIIFLIFLPPKQNILPMYTKLFCLCDKNFPYEFMKHFNDKNITFLNSFRGKNKRR
jgi:hypothetical protein